MVEDNIWAEEDDLAADNINDVLVLDVGRWLLVLTLIGLGLVEVEAGKGDDAVAFFAA